MGCWLDVNAGQLFLASRLGPLLPLAFLYSLQLGKEPSMARGRLGWGCLS
jgi:hypothetical protein